MRGQINNARWNLPDSLIAYLFMMPTILVLGIFVILPIFYAVVLSLNKVQLLGGIAYEFVGFQNFRRLIDDELVWIALKIQQSMLLLLYHYKLFWRWF